MPQPLLKDKLEEGEVAEVQWFDIADLKTQTVATPENFTPGFRKTMQLYY